MGSKHDYLENKVLDEVVNNIEFTTPGTVYSALFTVAPTDSTAGTEVTNAASGYTRVATTFVSAGATTPGRVQTSNSVTFATAAAGYTVVGWALMDGSTVAAGNILYWATVTTVALSIGDQGTFAAGGIVITED